MPSDNENDGKCGFRSCLSDCLQHNRFRTLAHCGYSETCYFSNFIKINPFLVLMITKHSLTDGPAGATHTHTRTRYQFDVCVINEIILLQEQEQEATNRW